VARVTSNEQLGAYRLIAAIDGEGPPDPRPGQFYMLATSERWGGGGEERPYLPRAFSYARAREVSARPGTDGGVELSFLLEAIGPGTERLAELRAGDGLAVVGPLGLGFRPPPEGRDRLILVGGGIGVAPLLCLSDELGSASVLLGFRSRAHAEAAGLVPAAEVATDDGSVGRHALVTELLREHFELGDADAAVFACGPPPMLEAVRLLCAAHRVPAQLALESGMACGFGACFGCVVPTREGNLRLCVDGPVLDAELLESAVFPGAGH